MAARAVARCACVTLARRLEGIDVYSNILYSRGEEGKAELSMLAQRAIAVDRYTPETCVVVGNYFSMMNKHEKAVQYFQRALVLNPEYLSAYTLMGHEFIETKNTSAALQAYVSPFPLCIFVTLWQVQARAGHRRQRLQGVVRAGADVRAAAPELPLPVLLQARGTAATP